ncbi:MAG: hypothetical protein GY883_05435 [Shimia sp.]|nr:hypothetical protein [Shimia sp.]
MPVSNNLRIMALCAAIGGGFLASFLADGAMAQERQRPEPPFAAIGAELGLSEQQVAGCFPKPERSEAGERPERPDMRAVISCIMEQDGTLSGDQIAQALKNNAPDRGGKRG